MNKVNIKKTIFNCAFIFLGSFFLTAIISVSFIFFYFHHQVSIMSNLITVSQHDDYKIYVYSDKPIPTSNLETICLGKNPSDIKAVIYIFKPNLFNTNGYNIGVIGKTDDMCNNDNFRKWESIEWKNDGVSFGNGEYFFSKQSFPSLK